MFYNAHVFFASKLYNSDSPLILIGSILPDIAITKIIEWDNSLHHTSNLVNLLKFVEKHNSSLKDLYKGVFSHRILDDFSHNNYRGSFGYAYQNNEGLSQTISKYYELDKEAAKRIAHNYFESAVDMLLLKENPGLRFKLKNAIEQVNIDSISDILSLYFGRNKLKFRLALVKYCRLISESNMENLKGLVRFWEGLEEMLYIKRIGVDKKTELLKLSINLAKNTYKDFINDCLKKSYEKIGI